MTTFHQNPILNSPYTEPTQHWELDTHHQPTHRIIANRRTVDFRSPVPAPRKQRGSSQPQLAFDAGLDSTNSRDKLANIINAVRAKVAKWRHSPEAQWRVTPASAQLLKHWRHHEFQSIRPFFCQIEAVETAIWLHEVAPHDPEGREWLTHLTDANTDANPGLFRIALKLATGTGKTTVMAMLIAWQTINAVRQPNSTKYTTGFLVVAPGLTIRDRLQVLLPNDAESYFTTRELIPVDMYEDIQKARVVITNYHAFIRRETRELSKVGRQLLQGHGPAIDTKESDGQMLQRVMPSLLGLKRVIVINDEAHHCYRQRTSDERLSGEDASEARQNNEDARTWISGLEAVARRMTLIGVYDLSATPFFLRGSGYAEGTLFPWTMSDFSLLDAIECGIVKLPRIPIVDNAPMTDMPMYRNLWEHIRNDMPRRIKHNINYDPQQLPAPLQTALQVLYSHYEKTFQVWHDADIESPPCFIIVCNNTASSKIIFDFIAGYRTTGVDQSSAYIPGRHPLFRNYDDYGNALPMPNTLLIDSRQLESGEALDSDFRSVASAEIEHFRRALMSRQGRVIDTDTLSDAELLREAMNTVGKKGRLGANIRCVVSVGMLTEGWDANTVTHILGVRAFSTQLLCEQVVGRALRRQSYDLNEHDLLNAEYADVFGIPFDFSAEPTVAPIVRPRESVHVYAMAERPHCEIRFPVVRGYRVELPVDQLRATFSDESVLVLSPQVVGATETVSAALIGQQANMNLRDLNNIRPSSIVFNLASHLLTTHLVMGNSDNERRTYLFGQLCNICNTWVTNYLRCEGGTYPGLLMYKVLADRACEKITMAIETSYRDEYPIRAITDPYNPWGSSRFINFTTSKELRYQPASAPAKCHTNLVIGDSTWEIELCRVLDKHPLVIRYIKNHQMNFIVPYVVGGTPHEYKPDFIVHVNDGRGDNNPLQLIVEVKGFRGEYVTEKHATVTNNWIPGVNHLRHFGRWHFVELSQVYLMESDLDHAIADAMTRLLGTQTS